MKEAIQTLVSKGAVRVVASHPQQFVSTLFLVEKGQGTGEFRRDKSQGPEQISHEGEI